MVVNYARDHKGAERVVREITDKGGHAIAVQGDVAQRSDAQRLVAGAKKAFGRLDVLVREQRGRLSRLRPSSSSASRNFTVSSTRMCWACSS